MLQSIGLKRPINCFPGYLQVNNAQESFHNASIYDTYCVPTAAVVFAFTYLLTSVLGMGCRCISRTKS